MTGVKVAGSTQGPSGDVVGAWCSAKAEIDSSGV
jgi:hypothetical protein